MKITNSITLFTLLIACTSSWAQGTAPVDSDSDGKLEIATKQNLRYLSENSNADWSADYEQTADIVFTEADFQDGGDFYNSGKGFSPIGNTTTAFTGSYNGQNHIIEYLTIVRSNESNVGLFGFINNAAISNVQMVDGSVNGISDVGSLVGHAMNSTVNNCNASLYVKCNGAQGGGLIGKAEGSTTSVENSSATGNVDADKFAGGLVGMIIDGTVNNCYAEGTVSAPIDGYAGGLIGDNDDTSISNSHATGDVSGQDNVGGLLGDNEGPVTNCYATGQITATDDEVGGLIGDHDVSDITDCYVTGSVNGDDDVGGLIGYVHGGAVITACYVTGAVDADENVGGIAGKMVEASSIHNAYCINTSVDGTYDVGGIVGDIDAGGIENSYAVNDVSASSSSENSGIAGYTSGGATITASFFDKTINTGMPDENDYGRTTGDMQTACTYFISDWDLAPSGSTAGTWTIDESTPSPANNGYPALAWQNLANTYTTNCQATSIAFSSVQPNQMTISWTNGGGSAGAVFMKEATTGTAAPVDGTTYTASTTFGDGGQIGTSGWYCIYNGTGSEVTVTGLTKNVEYIVHVTEYNGSAGSEYYLATSATDNPNTQITSVPGLWTGDDPNDNNWNTPDNWDDEQVPGTGVNVTIPDTGNDPVISAAATCQNITIENNGTLTINSSQTLNVSGDFTLNDGGGFSNNGTLKFSGTACELSDNRATKSSLGNVTVGN
ncbi:MAG: fibronectin type III domain-containing protein [Bacteroidales bacterium]|nr:fibronectin type III domain-containing protein [Bacteroidales bacterium]